MAETKANRCDCSHSVADHMTSRGLAGCHLCNCIWFRKPGARPVLHFAPPAAPAIGPADQTSHGGHERAGCRRTCNILPFYFGTCQACKRPIPLGNEPAHMVEDLYERKGGGERLVRLIGLCHPGCCLARAAQERGRPAAGAAG